jgi:hypothetical protein
MIRGILALAGLLISVLGIVVRAGMSFWLIFVAPLHPNAATGQIYLEQDCGRTGCSAPYFVTNLQHEILRYSMIAIIAGFVVMVLLLLSFKLQRKGQYIS